MHFVWWSHSASLKGRGSEGAGVLKEHAAWGAAWNFQSKRHSLMFYGRSAWERSQAQDEAVPGTTLASSAVVATVGSEMLAFSGCQP